MLQFQSLLPLFFSHTPAGTSIRNLDHYHQIYTTGNNYRKPHYLFRRVYNLPLFHYCLNKKGTFSRYDYGVAGNLEHYQQETAPSYDLKAVKAPVILVWGKEDTFSDPLVTTNSMQLIKIIIFSTRKPVKIPTIRSNINRTLPGIK